MTEQSTQDRYAARDNARQNLLGAELKVVLREGTLEQLETALTERPGMTIAEWRDQLAREVTEARHQKAEWQRTYDDLA